MDVLESLLSTPSTIRRSTKRQYLPFTESPFLGPYVTKVARRYNFSIPNAYTRGAFYIAQRALPMRRVLTNIEDRRMWSPSPITRDTSGRQVSPTDIGKYRDDPQPRGTPGRWSPNEPWINRPAHQRPRSIGEGLDWRPKFWTQLKNAPWWYGFANADKMAICIRRKIRREVMHALGLSGHTGQNTPRYNQYSHVRC